MSSPRSSMGTWWGAGNESPRSPFGMYGFEKHVCVYIWCIESVGDFYTFSWPMSWKHQLWTRICASKPWPPLHFFARCKSKRSKRMIHWCMQVNWLNATWQGTFWTFIYCIYVYSCWRHPRAPGSFVGFSGVQGSGVWCWSSLWMLEKMMLLVSRVCFTWHYKQVSWGFWGVMLKFVVDAREDDVVGVTRLLHVALTGFLGDAEVRCGC